MKISSINSGNVCYAECYLLAYNNNEGNKCDGLDWRAKQVVIQFLSRSDDDVVRQLRLLYKVLMMRYRSPQQKQSTIQLLFNIQPPPRSQCATAIFY